jgi:NhaP-type Na+/H+ or K+/H+ antiporter
MAEVESTVSAHPSGASLSLLVLSAAAGALFGSAYFVALRHSLSILAGRESLRRALLAMAYRLAAASLFFAFAVRLGAWPPIAAFLGFLAARQLAVRAARRAA